MNLPRHNPRRLYQRACDHLNRIIAQRGITNLLTAEDPAARRYRAYNAAALRLIPATTQPQEPHP